jgi:diguanylate cyclase (GGDEF)-like protein
MTTRILVVEDEDTLRTMIARVLKRDGYEVVEASSGEQALTLFRQSPFPLVLTDIVMGKMNGLTLLGELKLIDPDVLVIIMTSHASLDAATMALRSGAHDFLVKPFDDIRVVTNVVEQALDKLELARENRSLLNKLQSQARALEEANADLINAAIRDGMTCLYNYRHFRGALQIELQRCRRHKREFSLLFADIDYFKNYNDTHGHLAGDELLQRMAEILVDNCRKTDIVARYGGEEFVVILPETGKEGALTIGEKLRSAVEVERFSGEECQPGGRLTISLGTATFPGDGDDDGSLVTHVDQALYKAKSAGRNRIVAWEESLVPTPVGS